MTTKSTWHRNEIQFPRLLAEVYAAMPNGLIDDLAESMDLTIDDVLKLFDRAQTQWDRIKANTGPDGYKPKYPDISADELVDRLTDVDVDATATLMEDSGCWWTCDPTEGCGQTANEVDVNCHCGLPRRTERA